MGGCRSAARVALSLHGGGGLGVLRLELGAVPAVVFLVRDERGQVVERYVARLAVFRGHGPSFHAPAATTG